MRKTHTSKMFAALCGAFLTACSGGGGGGMSQSVAGSANAPSNTGTTAIDSFDTGVAGSVAAPNAAMFGTAPSQLATPGGPTFDGSSGSYSANVTFPLLVAGLQKTSTGLSATPADLAATATVTDDTSTSSTVQVVIPSLGINEPIIADASLTNGRFSILTGLSYVAAGVWGQAASLNTYSLQSNGVFVFGYETPQAGMPTSGSAVFSGPETATATVYKTVGTEIRGTNVEGIASISANFGSGTINGSLTQMIETTASTGTSPEPWNDVSITANIATGSNRFSGSTAAASAPGLPMSLSGSAVGKINGAFYGPAAQQLGAVWSLSDGTGSAIGTIVAGH